MTKEPYLIPRYWLLVFPGFDLGSCIFFLLFINDLPLSWESRNDLFADYAAFYASATTLTDVQSQLQRDLNSAAIWTKEHGMVAHRKKRNT